MTYIVSALMLLLQTQATSGVSQASLEGESNWLTASERAGRLGTAAGW